MNLCIKPLIWVILLAGASILQADEASKTTKIEQIFQASKMENLIGQYYKVIGSQVKSQAFRQLFGMKELTAQQQLVNEFQDKAMKLVTDTFSWSALEPVYVKLYNDSFSEEEIDGILAFYNSPAGQAMVAKTPQIMTAGSQVAQQKMVEMQPKMQALMQEFKEKVKAAAQGNQQ